MANLIKITRDDNYDYKWSVDGNKYGDKYDITSASGFADTSLANSGWEEVLAVNGGLFYTWESAHYACGLEKSRGVNNQDVSMTAVSDYNKAMAIAAIDDQLWFGKQEWIINNKLEAAYGALTGIGLLLDGKVVTYGHSEFSSQYKTKSGRTIIGEDKDGNFLSYSIKGETGSSGITGDEATKIAQDNGFYNAIMLDGGGSAWRRYFGAYDITTTRKVKNALILYRKKKSTTDNANESSVPMFAERLSSAGIKNNKFWYDASYNKGAKSSGTMLPNCFSGETEFITKNGIKRFDEVVDQDVEVLGKDNTWYKAHVNKFEAQPLFKVTFGDQQKTSYFATANHRWITLTSAGHAIIKTTEELMNVKNPRVPITVRSGLENIVPDLDGIYHGFIYGDGTYRKALNKTVMLLCGHKREFMKALLETDTRNDFKYYECQGGVLEVCYFDENYKQLPDISSCTDEYLLGFLVGYLAADGTPVASGSFELASCKEDTLNCVRDICAHLGLYTSKIRRQVHDTNFKKDAILYRMRIYKGLPKKFALNTKHKEKLESSGVERNKTTTRIVAIEPTDRVEPVYCVEEPINHEFTLANGVLTKNCTCYCVGRSEEIANQAVKIFPNISVGGFYDAKEWYSKSDWVGSNEPVVGGILCWGTSSDKYGHVAICERVLGNTGNGWKVLVSQSNYGGTFFETKEYIVNRGVKTSGVGFIYNGCLHNPYINDIRVSRDATKAQVEVLVDLVRIRKDANGDVAEGQFAAPGIYNIKETKEAGDYTWAKLDNERWIALNDEGGWTKTYLVDNSYKTDPELENEVDELKAQINTLNSKVESLNKDITELKAQNESLTTQLNEAKQAEVVAENKAKEYKEIIEAARVILERGE